MALAQHKNAQTTVHTIVWASDMPTTSAMSPWRPLITTIDNEWGLETHLEPSCMIFFLFYFFFFYTNMNLLLNRHHHQQDDTNVSTTSMHQDGTLEHRKRPKWQYIPSFVDCPKSNPGPGGPRSGPDQTPNVRVQVQIWVDLDPNYRSRSGWWVDWT